MQKVWKIVLEHQVWGNILYAMFTSRQEAMKVIKQLKEEDHSFTSIGCNDKFRRYTFMTKYTDNIYDTAEEFMRQRDYEYEREKLHIIK